MMILAAIAAAIYAAYIVVLRARTRHNKTAPPADRETRVVVCMSQRVADEIAEAEVPTMAEPWRRFVGFESDADLDWTKPC